MSRQIFVSHDKDDKELIGDLCKVIANTEGFHTHFEYFDRLNKQSHEEPPATRLKRQIENSIALIFLLGPETPPYKQAWIAWEVGIATECDIPIIVLERKDKPYDMVVPKLDDYILFDGNSEEHLREITVLLPELIRHHNPPLTERAFAMTERQRQQLKLTNRRTLTCLKNNEEGCRQEYGYWINTMGGQFDCPGCRRVEWTIQK